MHKESGATPRDTHAPLPPRPRPRARRALTLSACSSFFSKDVTFAIAAMYMLREPLPRSFPLRQARIYSQWWVAQTYAVARARRRVCRAPILTWLCVCVWTVSAPRK